MLFTHRDQVICGVQAQKKEKLKVTVDIDGNRLPPPPPDLFQRAQNLPSKDEFEKEQTSRSS